MSIVAGQAQAVPLIEALALVRRALSRAERVPHGFRAETLNVSESIARLAYAANRLEWAIYDETGGPARARRRVALTATAAIAGGGVSWWLARSWSDSLWMAAACALAVHQGSLVWQQVRYQHSMPRLPDYPEPEPEHPSVWAALSAVADPVRDDVAAARELLAPYRRKVPDHDDHLPPGYVESADEALKHAARAIDNWRVDLYNLPWRDEL